MVIDLIDRESASIKSFAVRKRDKIKVTMRFMSGKLHMFAKVSLKSFIYDIAEVFCFPTQVVAEIYKKYSIGKVLVYHILTATDSTTLQFIFIYNPNSDLPEQKFRDIIFKNIVATKIYKRFDSFYEFWDIFGFRKKSIRKKLGYCEIENIDNPCLVTITVNLKEYLKVLKKLKLNKKHKGIKKGSSGMDFENFANRIKSLVNFDTFEKPFAKFQQVVQLTVDKGGMVKKTVMKTKFSQLNDNKFYFSNGVLSLPFDQQNLRELNDFKREKGQKIEKHFWEEKEELLKMEKKLLKIFLD